MLACSDRAGYSEIHKLLFLLLRMSGTEKEKGKLRPDYVEYAVRAHENEVPFVLVLTTKNKSEIVFDSFYTMFCENQSEYIKNPSAHY